MRENNTLGVPSSHGVSNSTGNNTSNTTTDVATSLTQQWEEPFTYRNFVFSSVSLAVNTITIVVLCRTRLLSPRIRVILISMTTNDVLFSLVCGAMTSVPIWMILWTPLCYLLVYATIFSFFNSCFSITLITIDRMLALHCPLLYRQHATMTKTAVGVLATWLAAGLFTVLAHVSTSTQLTAHVVPCVSFAGGPSYGMLTISIISLVCVVAVTVMHVMIFLKIRKRQKLVAPAVFRFGLRSQIHHASANDDTGRGVARIVAETGCVAATVGVSAGTPDALDTAASPQDRTNQDIGSQEHINQTTVSKTQEAVPQTTVPKTEDVAACSERPQSGSIISTKAEFFIGDEKLGPWEVHGSTNTVTETTASSPSPETSGNSKVIGEKGNCMDRLMVPSTLKSSHTASSSQVSEGQSGTEWRSKTDTDIQDDSVERVIQASVDGNNTGENRESGDACKVQDNGNSQSSHSKATNASDMAAASTSSGAAEAKPSNHDGSNEADSTRSADDAFIEYKVLVPSPTPAGQLGSARVQEPFNHLGATEEQTGLKLLQGLLLGPKFSKIVATKIEPLEGNLTRQNTPEAVAPCSDDSFSDDVFGPPGQGNASGSKIVSLPHVSPKPAPKTAVGGKTIQTKAKVHAEATDFKNMSTPTNSPGPTKSSDKITSPVTPGTKGNKARSSQSEYNPNFLHPPGRTFQTPQTSASNSLPVSSPVKQRTTGIAGSGKTDPKQRPSVFTISDGKSLMAMKTAIKPEYSTALACTSAVAVGSVWSSASETISALSSTTIWSMHLPDLTKLENQQPGKKSLCERLARRLRSLYRWRFFSCTSAIGRAGALTVALTSTFIVAYVPISSYLVWASSQSVFVHEPSTSSVIYYMVLVNFVEGIVRPIIYIWRVVGFKSVVKTCTCCCRVRRRGRVYPLGH